MHRSGHSPEKTKTCSIGKGFYLPTEQAWGSLKVFHAYQLILSSAFFTLFISNTGPSLFGKTNSSLFFFTSASYLFITLFSTPLIRKNFLPFTPQVQLRIIFDIIMITLLMHTSGGITSGLGVLLAVSVAAGGLISGGQCTLVLASIATFAILGEQIYADKTQAFITTAYTYSGILSASFFTIAALAIVLTRRVEASENIAEQRSQDIHNLEQLNEHLIQHLHDGIIVTDQDFIIRLKNNAAEKLLNTPLELNTPLQDASNECWQLLTSWLRQPNNEAPYLSDSRKQAHLELHFNKLSGSNNGCAYTLFLKDLSPIDQQVQQGKLASLGQLTASIAHEIRNPLGAISHAGQLLSESKSLDSEEKQLLSIIHNHSNRVNSIVNDILQLSKNEQTHIESIHLKTWLSTFDKDFKEQFGLSESPIEILFEAPLSHITFDKHHLKQIIDNLCSNALKHGQTDSVQAKIQIRIGQLKPSQRFYISVCDNGKGIEEQLAKRVFEPFFTTSKSGTGLGLYISSQLANLNNANLNYQPPPAGGSCFSLLLPINTSDQTTTI